MAQNQSDNHHRKSDNLIPTLECVNAANLSTFASTDYYSDESQTYFEVLRLCMEAHNAKTQITQKSMIKE